MIVVFCCCWVWLVLFVVFVVFFVVEVVVFVEICFDYVYYVFISLVFRKFGWLEKSLDGSGIWVCWVFSQGSNCFLEYFNVGSVDFVLIVGFVVVFVWVNGSLVCIVYVVSCLEWIVLLVCKDLLVCSFVEFKGCKVVVIKGIDFYLFLFCSLYSVGLDKNDLCIVYLQYFDGWVVLEKGQVDVWVGFDLYMVVSELQVGLWLFYCNFGFNSYGVFNVCEDFVECYL